jgi:hypothetical protein
MPDGYDEGGKCLVCGKPFTRGELRYKVEWGSPMQYFVPRGELHENCLPESMKEARPS